MARYPVVSVEGRLRGFIETNTITDLAEQIITPFSPVFRIVGKTRFRAVEIGDAHDPADWFSSFVPFER
jgi:hypothetical protein